ncbi:uncharacterized protein LOC130014999 [Mercurialis annua]|uniref:uncharacterized protein LOC130014999 n=1 Tax=Mercurialis annua TaxID=3986 RepID=UPI0024AEC520|nr:uncharacterized protein LOC130014999 [Mercurialis annua]
MENSEESEEDPEEDPEEDLEEESEEVSQEENFEEEELSDESVVEEYRSKHFWSNVRRYRNLREDGGLVNGQAQVVLNQVKSLISALRVISCVNRKEKS